MRYLDIVDNIAQEVFAGLNIPDDIYKTFDLEAAEDFKQQYVADTSYLRSLVADKIYDSEYTEQLDLSPNEYDDLLEDIVDEVDSMLEDILNNYIKAQRYNTEFTFNEILQSIQALSVSPASDIVDIQTEKLDDRFPEYEVDIKLNNGATIHMRVDFEEDYDNI